MSKKKKKNNRFVIVFLYVRQESSWTKTVFAPCDLCTLCVSYSTCSISSLYEGQKKILKKKKSNNIVRFWCENEIFFIFYFLFITSPAIRPAGKSKRKSEDNLFEVDELGSTPLAPIVLFERCGKGITILTRTLCTFIYIYTHLYKKKRGEFVKLKFDTRAS